MIIVLNEWVFHDLRGDNGPERRRETWDFMDDFESSGNRLVIPNEDRWLRKAYRLTLMREPEGKIIGKLISRILRNDQIVIRAEPNPALVTGDLLRETPSEDIYLVEAYLSAGADMLVTTDSGLHGALADFSDDVSCRLRNDFLAGYSSA